MRKEKMRKMVVNISHGHFEGLMKLVNEKDFFNPSEALRYCIQQTIKREFPDYITSRTVVKTPEERAKEKMLSDEQIEEMKKQKAYEKKANICYLLGGEVVEINGHPHCKYSQYTELGGKKVDIGIVTDPFSTLSETSLDYQFRDIMGNTGVEAREKILPLIK